MKCMICNKEFGTKGIGNHIFNSHKDINSEIYYNLYINKISKICYCGKNKKFRNIIEGYGKYCSIICGGCDPNPLAKEIRSQKNRGRVQSKETIEKRIKNTNQFEKEKVRKSTMIERHGVDNPGKLEEVQILLSKKLRGRKNPRVEGQQDRIIATKTKNGTHKHTQKTKDKIGITVRALYASDNPPVTISNGNNKFHKHGYINGFYYRSSYELKFLEFCFFKNIKIEAAENKKFRLPYIFEGKRKWYYPDFYLPDYDMIVEIKPNSMLTIDQIQLKIDAGCQNYSYRIIDEETLADLEEFYYELENY